MNPRQNLLSLYRRRGFEATPVCFNLCPHLERQFRERYPGAADYPEQFEFPMRLVTDPGFPWIAERRGFVPSRRWNYDLYYDPPVAPGARMDILALGDDLGMQRSIMMSREMYRTWLKPRLKRVTVNEAKTHICRLPEESFDFLGYTFGRCYSTTGLRYIGQRPSQKKIAAICRQISEWTTGNWCWIDVEEQVGRLNRMLVGWANYFCQGPITKAYRRITQHARQRLRQWLRRKHQQRGWGYSRFPDEYLHGELGLVQLRLCDRNVPWGDSMSPCPKAGCGKSARPV
jgi:hypothetical protein